jgi:DNA-binding response OmpR family regulator
MARILLVDDEADIVRFVRRALEAEGHEVTTALDGADGLRLALTEQPDLVVLDLLMPGVDGQAVLSGIVAQAPHLRVLILSAAADVESRVSCLERGAVDFLAKPFALRELLMRVRSRLSEEPTGRAKDSLRVGRLVLDLRHRRLNVGTETCDLSQREFLLLQHLMRRPGAVCSREELLADVWGYDFDPGTNVVDVYVGRLRAKLCGEAIRTVRNVGYELRVA